MTKTYTMSSFEKEGFTCKLLPWSMLLVYKPCTPVGEEGFKATVYKFKSCDYFEGEDLTWVIPTKGEVFIECIAYYDGIRHLNLHQGGKPSNSLDGEYASEMLLPSITELKDLEQHYCMNF